MPKKTWTGGGIVEGIGISFNGGGFAQKPERQRIKNDEAERDREREERLSSLQRSSPEAPVAEAVIVDAVRTARGKRKGSLSTLHPLDLAAQTLRAAIEHSGAIA